jgi:midasin (ATPase involved in ribosome maturation)
MLNIQSILKGFEPISLAEMDSVALMERTDLKFTLKIEAISELLKLLNKTYKCLEINNCRLSSYQTEYLDDHKNILFTNHQNGKLNRFKIRFRDYIQSKITFLEIKFKSNKGVTKKK